MGDKPSSSGSCDGYSTLFKCALGGVQALLQAVQPCLGGANCTSSNTQFRVALFSFPNITTATAADDYNCKGTPTDEPYTLPYTKGYPNETSYLTSYTPLTYSKSSTTTIPMSTYENTPISNNTDGDAYGFSSNYWSATATGNLNTESSIVKAVTGCMKNPGGESTYYTSVIYAAQAALAAEQAANGGNNAIIILSDGEAQADYTKFPSTGNAPQAGTGSQATLGFTVATNSSSNKTTNLTGVSKTFGYYPDFHDECQQAIMAAQAAQAAGTTVFSVAFGSEPSGCSAASGGTDSTTIATATSGNSAISYGSITPCLTMKNIASPATSTASYFYADSSSKTSGCTDTAHTVSQINQIFLAISSYFTTPRLLPNNAT
jgi:hypothetical protein